MLKALGRNPHPDSSYRGRADTNGEEKQRGFREVCLGLDEEIEENIYAPDKQFSQPLT